MTVKAILDVKGHDVMTIGPDSTLADAAKLLSENRIGALVVTRGDDRIAGILSERDIVRIVGAKGGTALELPVSKAMTAAVKVCQETNTAMELMEIMTQGRFRHLPVEKDGKLDGIISIGDVVKLRIEEVLREAEDIKSYIATA
ncbi:MAG: CBS domain-containing protein [Rhizobiaceae bacterium]|jgi:CBS domain-containing protein|nr:CBS domain-containing protein [Rhizobiaceae bacterium]